VDERGGSELRELAESVFGGGWDNTTDAFDVDSWQTCEQTGLARLTLSEAAGGSGGSLTDAATVLTAAGQYAARLPLVETDLLAGWLLHTSGLPVPTGPLSAVAASELEVDGERVSGTLRRIPWGRAALAVVVLTDDHVVLLDPSTGRLVPGTNLAGEPRDDLILDEVVAQVAAATPQMLAEYPLRAAVGRSLLLAGATRGALAMAVTYATQRVQFGRPIATLQSIQQSLALAAAEVTAAVVSSHAAAARTDERGFAAAAMAIAAAKSRTGQAAGEVARIAHQVHGAIGITHEHDLRMLTTRLWAWRDEDGPESFYTDWLGGRALDVGGDGLWPLLSS
jgi:acyl-CoA dehydrogenase